MSGQRHWEQIVEGEALDSIAFPLSRYRLVMAAGAHRDFNAIHHNPAAAHASGAADIYANNYFLQAMWERTVRGYIGDAGIIRRLSGFRMRAFNTAADTVTVYGRVARKWMEGGNGLAEIALWSENGAGISVGPGAVVVWLPLAGVASSG